MVAVALPALAAQFAASPAAVTVLVVTGYLIATLVLAVRRTGYDRRALGVQAAIALAVMVVSRLTLGPDENQNFTWRDPFLGRSWGPAPVHVGLTWAVLVGAVYWPTHAALKRLMPRAATSAPPSPGGAR